MLGALRGRDGRAWRPVPRNRACGLGKYKPEGSKESKGCKENTAERADGA